MDVHGVFKRRRVVGFDIHSQFLHSDSDFSAIHARDWQPEASRPVLCSFLGSQDPDSRKHILDGVRHLFVPTSTDPTGADAPRSQHKSMYWHEYSDAVPAPLGPKEFLQVLSSSDFCLCPRGYSLVTHRPMEALLRGSIPVLAADQLDLYGIELEDGVNCIAVPDGRWSETIESLKAIQEDVVVRMRRNIQAMLQDRLSYDAVARQIATRLGVRASAA
jgi:hypothetical protein